MGLPFIDGAARTKRDQMLAIDLGGRMTKAVHVQRRGDRFVLSRYAMLDAPIFEKTLSVDLLSEHLSALVEALGTRARFATLAVGVAEALVRHVEMPRMSVEDTRRVLKINSKNYLQHDLPNHVFDCQIIAPRHLPNPAPAGKAPADPQKQKILVTAARQQLIQDYQAAMKNAGLVADRIIPGLIGPVNAFERAMPEVFSRDAVALVDIGFKHSTICILQEGELILSRVVAIGGDRLTGGLADSLGTSYAEAEGIKVGMINEVQSTIEALLTPLGRELRASVDFFEHQRDRPLNQVYLTGASARSQVIVQALQNELMAPCTTWSPTTFLQLELPAEQAAEIDAVASQLTVAIGAAMTGY